MTNWRKLPGLTPEQAGLRSHCVNCGAQPVTLTLGAELAVGFGDTVLTKDGEVIWRETDWRYRVRHLRGVEWLARRDPDHDWRILYDGPLSSALYQRQGRNEWVLVKKGRGFA